MQRASAGIWRRFRRMQDSFGYDGPTGSRKIDGLSPVISIEQRPRHGTHDLLWAPLPDLRFSAFALCPHRDAYSYETGEKMVKFTEEQILEFISEHYKNKKKKITIPAPLVRVEKVTTASCLSKHARRVLPRCG